MDIFLDELKRRLFDILEKDDIVHFMVKYKYVTF